MPRPPENPVPIPAPVSFSATAPQECCSSEWEKAYLRFETPQEEIRKFMRRLRKMGADSWARDSRIVEICCGRGNGLRALKNLGFDRVEGLDLSATLIGQYGGDARCYIADCRSLPFDSDSRDIVVVQGGLHHLPSFPSDLEQSLGEIARILRPGGLFCMVEPWLTTFLHLVHFVSELPLARRVSRKIDSFATMTEQEHETYFRWLNQPGEILRLLESTFKVRECETRWGKLVFVGEPVD